MPEPTVRNLPFNPEFTTDYGDQHTDDRYRSSRLTLAGPVFYMFKEDSSTGPITMDYEEIQYVIEGEMTLTVDQDGTAYSVVGKPGDVLSIERGSTVTFSAPKGTRCLVVISPMNREDLTD
ncbi:MAG: cupin domain-containing protein [Microbacterium sp.]